MGGLITQWIAYFLPTQGPGFESQHFQIFFTGNFEVAVAYQHHYLNSGQRLDDVDQTHQVLAIVASEYYKKLAQEM